MTSYTIGYRREDGDFAILATLNNNDGLLGEWGVNFIKTCLINFFLDATRLGIVAIERQDAPDYVDLGEGE